MALFRVAKAGAVAGNLTMTNVVTANDGTYTFTEDVAGFIVVDQNGYSSPELDGTPITFDNVTVPTATTITHCNFYIHPVSAGTVLTGTTGQFSANVLYFTLA